MREPAPCGTEGAYHRHLRKDEPIDDACRQAHNEHAAIGRKSKWINDEAIKLLVSRHHSEFYELKARVIAREMRRVRRERERRDARLFELFPGGKTT